MSQLNKETLLAKRARNVARVVLPSGHVFVRELYGNEFDALTKRLQDKRGNVSQLGLAARMAVACICDEDGEALFVDGDEAKLNEALPVAQLLKVTKAASALNGLDEADEAELLGNSETTTPNGSGTV